MGECLGCGATGAVYHAWWQGSEVAVKQLSLFCLDSKHIADFYAEAVREAEAHSCVGSAWGSAAYTRARQNAHAE